MSETKPERIDLASLDTSKRAEEGTPLQLKHPVTGELLEGWVLQVRGYDSASYQQILEQQQRARLQRLGARKNMTTDELRIALTEEMDQGRAEGLQAAAALVCGWPDSFDLDEQALPYSAPNAVRLLTRFSWMREQVERHAANRGNFLPGSASS